MNSSHWRVPLIALALALCSCRRSQPNEIELSLVPGQTVRFAPRAGFAEYFELPGLSDQLRITLSSYDADCLRFIPPPPHKVSVVLTIESPPGQTLGPGDYAYDVAQTTGEGARVLPFVRLHEGGDRLHASGRLRLQKFEPSLHGLVQGELEFLTPSEGTSVALSGKFNVRICRSVLDPTRNKDG